MKDLLEARPLHAVIRLRVMINDGLLRPRLTLQPAPFFDRE